jgi:hypothetical protein
MAQVAKKKGVPLCRVTTPGGFEIQFLHEEGYAKGVRGGRGIGSRDRRWRDPPPGNHPFAGLKTIQALVNKMPVSNANVSQTARWAPRDAHRAFSGFQGERSSVFRVAC